MTLLSQTIEFVDIAASSLWSRAVEAVETAREARRAREHYRCEAQSGCAGRGMTALEA